MQELLTYVITAVEHLEQQQNVMLTHSDHVHGGQIVTSVDVSTMRNDLAVHVMHPGLLKHLVLMPWLILIMTNYVKKPTVLVGSVSTVIHVTAVAFGLYITALIFLS